MAMRPWRCQCCCAVDSSRLVNFGNGSQALIAWNASTHALILAFSASQQDNTSLTQATNDLESLQYTSTVFGRSTPRVTTAAYGPFRSLLDNITASTGAINAVTNGEMLWLCSMDLDPLNKPKAFPRNMSLRISMLIDILDHAQIPIQLTTGTPYISDKAFQDLID